MGRRRWSYSLVEEELRGERRAGAAPASIAMEGVSSGGAAVAEEQ
jgi:hypothetical protein